MNYPRLLNKELVEVINLISLSPQDPEFLEPCITVARINGGRMEILRDTGASVDLINVEHISVKDYISKFLKTK